MVSGQAPFKQLWEGGHQYHNGQGDDDCDDGGDDVDDDDDANDNATVDDNYF